MAGGRLALVVLAALLLAAASTEGGYVLSHDYSGPNFFDHFDFWSYDDPTHGYVDYVTQQQAQGTMPQTTSCFFPWFVTSAPFTI
jgi:hypothetical protein